MKTFRERVFDFYKMQDLCPTLETMIPPAKELGRITAIELYELTPDEYTAPDGRVLKVRKEFCDVEYVLTSKAEIERWLKWNLTNNYHYQRILFDCNRFAVKLWGDGPAWTPGLCLGKISIHGEQRHGRNWFVDEKKVIWEIEGGTDKIFRSVNSPISSFQL